MEKYDVIAVSHEDGTHSPATFNMLGNAMQEMAEQQRNQASDGAVGRDLSIAITHLEDAMTRYNSAQYRRKGVWKRADPDATPTA